MQDQSEASPSASAADVLEDSEDEACATTPELTYGHSACADSPDSTACAACTAGPTHTKLVHSQVHELLGTGTADTQRYQQNLHSQVTPVSSLEPTTFAQVLGYTQTPMQLDYAADRQARTPRSLSSLMDVWEVQDVIYGKVELPMLCHQLAHTPAVARLRSLRQLGAAHWVFPSANHSRYEHSLGVAVKATQLALALHNSQTSSVSLREIQLVAAAGLLHDLGHGPFSHAFESCVMQPLLAQHGGRTWHHEDMGCRLIDHMYDMGDIPNLERCEVEWIKHMITGNRRAMPADKQHLCDIVANERHGWDVDKIDYLKRDVYYTGVAAPHIAVDEVLHGAVVGSGRVLYDVRHVKAAWQVFETRAYMYQRVYTHRTVKGYELMVADAVLEAAEALDLLNRAEDPAQFLLLDEDTVMGTIKQGAACENGRLKSACQLYWRACRGQPYVCAGELHIPEDVSHNSHWSVPSATELLAYSQQGTTLDASQISVDLDVVHHGKKSVNPLTMMDWHSQGMLVDFNQQQQALEWPSQFQTKTLRVFSKDRKPAVVQAVKLALQAYAREHFCNRPQASARLHQEESSGQGLCSISKRSRITY